VALACCARLTVPSPSMADEKRELKIVTTVGSAPEAALVCGRLTEAGIRAMQQRGGGGGRWGAGGARDVYVEEQDLGRAREVLKADKGGFSDEELALLSEEAGRAAAEDDSSPAPTQPTPPKDKDKQRKRDEPVETPVPKKHHTFNVLERIARGKPDADSADNPFGH
jgi:hypothetical protein